MVTPVSNGTDPASAVAPQEITGADDGMQGGAVADQYDGAPEPTPTPSPATEDVTPEPISVSSPTTEELRLTEENVVLRRSDDLHQKEAAEGRLQSAAAEYAQTRINYHINQGHDEQTARQVGVLEAKEQIQAYRAEQAGLRADRIEAAQEFNVPISELAELQTRDAIRLQAERYSNTTGPQAKIIQEQNARLQAMEKQIANMRAPAQTYNQAGQPVGGGNAIDIWRQFGRGDIPWSPEVQRAGQSLNVV